MILVKLDHLLCLMLQNQKKKEGKRKGEKKSSNKFLLYLPKILIKPSTTWFVGKRLYFIDLLKLFLFPF